MKRAIFDVDPVLIKDLMHMPAGASIVSVVTTQRGFNLVLRFVVEDASLPEADSPHEVTPKVTVERYLWNWGVYPPEDEAA